jgi:phage terminase large subunit-like protein
LKESALVGLLKELTDEEAILLQHHWMAWARAEQLPPSDPDWVTWLILAGRGFGKTRAGAEWVRMLVESGNYGRIALVAEDAGDARDVIVEGESGILATAAPWFRPKYEPSKKRLTWPNGAMATLYSADDPEALRGPQFDAAWLDELCKWRYAREAWDMLQFGLRLGVRPLQCVTTTPRPIPLLKDLMKDEATRITRGSTYDNQANLADQFYKQVQRKYEGTRLGRQEIFAEILDDNPNALWTYAQIEQHRVRVFDWRSCAKIVVAIDPPASSNENSDECGIIVVGKTEDDHYWVLADGSVQGKKPYVWATKAISLYHTFQASTAVAEINQGGDLVVSILNEVDKTVPVHAVRATRGKWLRAEPVAGLYEQGRVHHVGLLATLEDQMIDFNPTGEANGRSPDRLDALVWGITYLMKNEDVEPKIRSL